MKALNSTHWTKKATAAVVLPFAALALASCGTSGPEEGADVEDVNESEEVVEEDTAAVDEDYAYDGRYDTGFYEDYDSLIGEQVTVSAQVNEIISPESFTIAGTDDTTVDELLIVHDMGEISELQQGLTVAVTGTVLEGFDLVTVEEDLGVDLDDDLFTDMDGERYISATTVDTSVDADQD